MMGSGTMYPWSRSRTLGKTYRCSGPVRVTHYFVGFRASPNYIENCELALTAVGKVMIKAYPTRRNIL